MRQFLDTILHNDCVEAMSVFDPESIDLTVSSPPYDGLRLYYGFHFDCAQVAKALLRVTKPGGVVVWVVADAVVDGGETGTSFRQALTFQEAGFRIHDTMIYEKNACSFPTPTRRHPLQPDHRVHVRVLERSSEDRQPALRQAEQVGWHHELGEKH